MWDDLADAHVPTHKRAAAPVDYSGRHIGCPVEWFRLVLPVVRGKGELAVALYLYRLRWSNETARVGSERAPAS